MPAPQPGPDDAAKIQQIVAQLKHHHAGSVTGAMGQFLLGAGICVGVGVVLSFLIVFILVCAYGTSWLGMSGWLGVYLLVLVPILIWQERRSRNDYLLDAVRSADQSPSSAGEYEVGKARVMIATYTEMILWGPRAIIDGYRGLRGTHSGLQKAGFDRAGLLVLDLAKSMGGVEIKRLVHPPEDMKVFGAAVDLLDRHSWIGRSGDGASLWLNSTWREKLKPIIQNSPAMNRR